MLGLVVNSVCTNSFNPLTTRVSREQRDEKNSLTLAAIGLASRSTNQESSNK